MGGSNNYRHRLDLRHDLAGFVPHQKSHVMPPNKVVSKN
jgi:hypothetical protein